MNARVGSVPSSSIGCEEPERENDNGLLWRSFLEHFSMVAVNTFYPAGRTWTSGHLTTARLDYIGLEAPALRNVTACHVPDSIDLTLNEWEDHAAVVVCVRLNVDTSGARRALTPAAVDKRTLGDPVRIENFH